MCTVCNENIPNGFGFGDAWSNVPTYRKYISTSLWEFVMTGYVNSSTHNMYSDLMYGYGRFIRSVLCPTVPTINYSDAIMNALMYPRLVDMLLNNWRSRYGTHGTDSDYLYRGIWEAVVLTDDVRLILKFLNPKTCLTDGGYSRGILQKMGPAVYRFIKPYVLHVPGDTDMTIYIRLSHLARNDRCDAFFDLFETTPRLVYCNAQILFEYAVYSKNVRVVKHILDMKELPLVIDSVDLSREQVEREVFDSYHHNLLSMLELLVSHNRISGLGMDAVRRVVRVCDDAKLVEWMLDMIGTTDPDKVKPALPKVGNAAIAHGRKQVWRILVTRGMEYTSALANAAAVHDQLDLLDEMHRGGVDCTRDVTLQMHDEISRAVRAWVARYGV